MQEPPPSSSAERPEGRVRQSFALTLAVSGLMLLIPNLGVMSLRLNYEISEDTADLLQGLFSLTGSILGVVAWIQARSAFRTSLNPALKITKMLAIISTFAHPGVIVLTALAILFTSAKLLPGKDSIINDLSNLSAHAYQYRIRPLSMKGGGGAYTGYEISPALSKNENGFYTSSVVHPDTIQFLAKWLDDSTATISVKIGPDGYAVAKSWIYTGTFKK